MGISVLRVRYLWRPSGAIFIISGFGFMALSVLRVESLWRPSGAILVIFGLSFMGISVLRVRYLWRPSGAILVIFGFGFMGISVLRVRYLWRPSGAILVIFGFGFLVYRFYGCVTSGALRAQFYLFLGPVLWCIGSTGALPLAPFGRNFIYFWVRFYGASVLRVRYLWRPSGAILVIFGFGFMVYRFYGCVTSGALRAQF